MIFLWFLSALGYSIYSFLYPFYESLNDIKNYNIAYYGALWSVERAHLILRFRKAWFEGSWWWAGNSNFGPDSDGKIANFWFLSKLDNGMWWEISSRVESIPESWKWDIPIQLQFTWTEYWWPSSNFNMLEPNLPLQIAMFMDDCENSNAYNENCNAWFTNISGEVKIVFRLPPKIYGKKWDLDDGADIDWNGISDDVIVNRSLFGSWGWEDFSIFPTINVDYTNNIVESQDTAIRESIVNLPTNGSNTNWNVIFWNSKQPIRSAGSISRSDPPYHNIIPLDHSFSGSNFTTIFSNSDDIYLKFSIVNFMQTTDSFIYPFLEYKIKVENGTNPITIPDRFFHIKGIWKVWKYKVQILLKQPIIRSSAASDFVIIF